MSLIGAVDIGGTKIAAAAVREDGTVLHPCECPTKPHLGFLNSMLRVKGLLRKVADSCGAFDGIGVCCPGPLDPLSGVIGDVGTLPGWQGGNLVAELEREFQVRVAVENDADAAALAEYKWGVGKEADSFIYITISTGIGGGMIFGGQLYRGAQRAHPEIGHQVIADSGPLCYCGARGCWESLASGTAMSEWMRGIAPERGLLSAAEICRRAADGDDVSLSATRRESYYLGLGLANIMTLFTPEVIALGGGVMKSSSLFLGEALVIARRLCTQVPVNNIRVAKSSLGADVGVRGAAQGWISRYA